MTYQASLAPIPKAVLDTISCHRYINQEVAETELEQWDNWFMLLRQKPHVYSIARKGEYTFYVDLKGEEVDVDWRVYCTWSNTFHLRYEPLLNELGIKSAHPYINPEQQFLVAKMMEGGRIPKALADCSVGTELKRI